MKINELDGNVLQHIVKHCNDLETALEFFGKNYKRFETNPLFKNTCSMSIMQIGELAKSFSDEFIQATNTEVPWKPIKGIRSHFAHGYHLMDTKIIWKVVIEEAPKLNKFCKQHLKENHISIPKKYSLGLHR